MSKSFLEVFAGVKLTNAVSGQFEDVEVLKITSTSRRDFLRIYIQSEHLIPKEIIYKAEKEIKNQLFKDNELTVKIYEKYRLSAQYTPENLINSYWDSILVEFREYDHIMYIALKEAEIRYPEQDRIELTLEDTVLAKSREEEMLRILNKIFTER
ncbi:MAG: PolC-type DNA polymerase III N-terminal domain-containing protein, partial [Lachnospiraceae bacterium]